MLGMPEMGEMLEMPEMGEMQETVEMPGMLETAEVPGKGADDRGGRKNNTGCRVFYGILSMVAPRHRQYGQSRTLPRTDVEVIII